jgi:diadenosine tetraphosphate (Ap4A) HIT family hydrolase
VDKLQPILEKFGYENLLIKEYENWYLLLRKEQATIGSLVLIEKSFKTKYSDISSKSHNEFGRIVKDIEYTLGKLFSYDKINYLMLMMVDNEVHYHIIPRYSEQKYFKDKLFEDKGWPGLPTLSEANIIDKKLQKKIMTYLRGKFNSV